MICQRCNVKFMKLFDNSKTEKFICQHCYSSIYVDILSKSICEYNYNLENCRIYSSCMDIPFTSIFEGVKMKHHIDVFISIDNANIYKVLDKLLKLKVFI